MFGSAARGDMHVNSDIDFLVIRPDNADEDAWEQQLTGPPGPRVGTDTVTLFSVRFA